MTESSPIFKNYNLKTNEKYRTTLINFEKYKLVMFAMAKDKICKLLKNG